MMNSTQMATAEKLLDFAEAAPVGENVLCPTCSTSFVKTKAVRKFCTPECKTTYWNGARDRYRSLVGVNWRFRYGGF